MITISLLVCYCVVYLHSIALPWTQDASGSIKKIIQRTTTIISWAVKFGPGGFSIGIILDANKRFTPLCRCCARVYWHNCERSPTLQVESLLFVPRSWAKTPGNWVLLTALNFYKIWWEKLKNGGKGSVGKDRGLGVCLRASNIVECFVQNNPKMISFQYT